MQDFVVGDEVDLEVVARRPGELLPRLEVGRQAGPCELPGVVADEKLVRALGWNVPPGERDAVFGGERHVLVIEASLVGAVVDRSPGLLDEAVGHGLQCLRDLLFGQLRGVKGLGHLMLLFRMMGFLGFYL